MPSPIAHSVVGLALGGFLLSQRGGSQRVLASNTAVALAVVAFALLPDLGSVAGVVTGDFARFHNSWEHSLITGVAVALIIGGLARLTGSPRSGRWFLVSLLCYELHVIMDFLTWGRGVRILWPLWTDRLRPPFYLFYGLHWSDGWLSSRHLVTLLTEGAFAVLVVLALLRFLKPHRPADQRTGGSTPGRSALGP